MSAVESKDINAEAGADMNAKPQSALICGSMAFDTIIVFPVKFQHHILPDKLHMLKVSFFVPELRREFGCCAGNIA